jgi:Rap1a immunity proteins
MKGIGALALGFAMAATTSVAWAEFRTGNDLKQRLDGFTRAQGNGATAADYRDAQYAMGFVTGVWDIGENALFCADNVTVGQIVAVVRKYVEDRPAEWSRPAAALAVNALQQAFPCAKK